MWQFVWTWTSFLFMFCLILSNLVAIDILIDFQAKITADFIQWMVLHFYNSQAGRWKKETFK